MGFAAAVTPPQAPDANLLDEIVMRSPTMRLGELVRARFSAFAEEAMKSHGPAMNKASFDHLFMGQPIRASDRDASDEERFF
jgi:hypothetical protein